MALEDQRVKSKARIRVTRHVDEVQRRKVGVLEAERGVPTRARRHEPPFRHIENRDRKLARGDVLDERVLIIRSAPSPEMLVYPSTILMNESHGRKCGTRRVDASDANTRPGRATGLQRGSAARAAAVRTCENAATHCGAAARNPAL
ncbi:MAG TPA: hypothetical protein VGP92_13295 [Acidimicrobiia bacterium]|nr:hypothetical protein [Acidimicrobiia bacterium]